MLWLVYIESSLNGGDWSRVLIGGQSIIAICDFSDISDYSVVFSVRELGLLL